jgi:WD40 repeat protein
VLATRHCDGPVRLWSGVTGEAAGALPTAGYKTTALTLSPNGKTLAEADDSGGTRVWDLAAEPFGLLATLEGVRDWMTFPLSGHTLATLHSPGPGGLVEVMTFSPDGQALLTGHGQTLRLWRPGPGQVPVLWRQWDLTTGRLVLARNPPWWADTQKPVPLAAPTPPPPKDEPLRPPTQSWVVETFRSSFYNPPWYNRILGAFPAQADQSVVGAVTFLPGGSIMASGGSDGEICLWEAGNWQGPQAQLERELGEVLPAELRERWLRQRQHEQELAWRHLRRLPGDSVRQVPPGLQQARDECEERLAREAAVRRTVARHARAVTVLAFTPDGRTGASGSRDETVQLWDVATGQLLRTLTGHRSAITALAFAPDGRTLATGGADGMVLLWDVPGGGLLTRLPCLDRVLALWFHPAGIELRVVDAGVNRLAPNITALESVRRPQGRR